MVKKFTANCDFGGQKAPVTLYIGNPAKGSHPLGNQSKWLSENRGGNIPGNIMESFAKLQELSEKNKVPFEELCEYAIKELNAQNELQKQVKKSSELSASNVKKSAEAQVSPIKKEPKKQQARQQEIKQDDKK